MIDEYAYKVLTAISKEPKTPSSLEVAFGEKIYTTLDKLENKGYVFLEHGEGFMGGVIHYKLSDNGNQFLNDYCDACECLPCDCGWGN